MQFPPPILKTIYFIVIVIGHAHSEYTIHHTPYPGYTSFQVYREYRNINNKLSSGMEFVAEEAENIWIASSDGDIGRVQQFLTEGNDADWLGPIIV